MDETVWHKCKAPLWPRWKVVGGWTYPVGCGQTWRRKRPDGKWEYAQDEVSYEEWADRQ